MTREVIKVENVSHFYDMYQALKGISFSVADDSEIVGLLGPNGAGKTTLINILSTIMKPTEGKIEILGYDIVKKPDKVRSLIGMIPQKNIMLDYSMTVFDTLHFSSMLHFKKNREDILTVLELFGLLEVKDKRIYQLSGGMIRKLLLARLAFSTECKLLFLDEPTSGIDIYGKRMFHQYLKAMQKDLGVQIIITTHDLLEAQELCDRVLIINKGQMIKDVILQEIMEKYDKKITVKFHKAFSFGELQKVKSISPNSIVQYPDGTVSFFIKDKLYSYQRLVGELEDFSPIDQLVIDQITLEEYFRNAIKESTKDENMELTVPDCLA